ncbi:MAG: MBL fold metallo-hydrolase [Lachnospiraceae bacterium]|nr:MBL fold metallo-hydrolase [Lachnospiraceae bacterium]
MKVTVLIENTAPEELTAEHGLSFFINFRGKNYLLDSGSTGAFMENASKQGIPLEQTDTCFLSHGHYDHSGGFAEMFRKYGERPIYAMETAGEKYYSGSGGSVHEIGVPGVLLEEYGHCFHTINKVTQVSENIYLLPHNTPGLEVIGERTKLYREEGGELLPDDFGHEMSVVFHTDGGLVVFNSCSHSGASVILDEVAQVFPGEKVLAFLGGLHMKGRKKGIEICAFSEEEVQRLAEDLKNRGLERLYTGHCTGAPGLRLLQKYLGDRVQALTTGMVIAF